MESYRALRDRAEFLFVYVREAHPADSNWPDRMIVIADPEMDAQRAKTAKECRTALGLEFPTVVDTVDDSVSLKYGAWPERIYVIARGGRVAYKGGVGPFGFDPAEARAVLESLVGLPKP